MPDEETMPDESTPPEEAPSDDMDMSGSETSEMSETEAEPKPINLRQITSSDAATLEGELGCAFITSDSTSLMAARANVQGDTPPTGVVNDDGTTVALLGKTSGDFNMLETRAGSFTGTDLTVTVTLGDPSTTKASETVSHFADMIAQRDDGTERTYEGQWVCGP